MIILVVSYLLPDRKSYLYNFTMHDIALHGSQSYQIFYCYFNGQSDAFIGSVSSIQASSLKNYKLKESVDRNNCPGLKSELSELFDAVYKFHFIIGTQA